MQENQFTKAVREWLAELDDMPTFRTGTCRYGSKQNKTMSEGVVNGLVRDIVRNGLRFFYDVSEGCRTYGELQRKLSREWLANEAGKTRKSAQRARVCDANARLVEWGTPKSSFASSTDASSISLDDCGSPVSEGGSTEYSSASTAASSQQQQRRVKVVTPGAKVTAHNVRLAPALNNVTGKLIEATKDNRFLIQFPAPYNRMSLKPCNVLCE